MQIDITTVAVNMWFTRRPTSSRSSTILFPLMSLCPRSSRFLLGKKPAPLNVFRLSGNIVEMFP